MLPLRHTASACAVALMCGLVGLPTAANAEVFAVPPASTATITANRAAAAVYDQYAGSLATIASGRKAVAKYSASTAAVAKDQARIAAYSKTAAAARLRLAAWRTALAGVADPATFVPASDNPIAAKLAALAPLSRKAKTAAIKKAVGRERKALAKANKGLRKYRKLLKGHLTAQAKDAPRLAAAQAALDAALAAAPGVEQQFQTALAALNAVTGLAAINPALPRGVVQPVNPGPECVPGQQVGYETVIECGKVTKVLDGDTVIVRTTTGASVMVRNSTIQATEVAHLPIPAQCLSWQAKTRMQDLLMPRNAAGTRVGVTVQLRALFADSVNLHSTPRPYRTVYAFDTATGGYTRDVQKDLAQRGLVLWFPVYKPGDPARESYHHGEYLEDINRAAAAGLGLYNPTACGQPILKLADGTVRDPQYDITPLLRVSWLDSNEYVDIKNPSTTESLDLSKWKLRNKNLEFFTFPDGSVLPPGAVGRLYTRTIPTGNGYPYVWSWNRPLPNINTPMMITCTGLTDPKLSECSTYNQGWLMGTGVYLMDYQAGTDSVTGYPRGGNLRAFVHVPCNYTYATNSIGSSSVCNAAFAMPANPVLDTSGVVGVDQATALATLASRNYLNVALQGTGSVVTFAALTYTGFNQSLVTLTLGS